MGITIRITSRYKYKGRSYTKRSEKVFEDVEQARRYVRKVTQNAREEATWAEHRRNRRNQGSLVSYISVWPEGVKEGDTLDVWNHERGWHKGVASLRNIGRGETSLRAHSLEEK